MSSKFHYESSISWHELDEANLKIAWRLVSKHIGKDLFDSSMTMVGNIGDANYYDILVCFVKEQRAGLSKLYSTGKQYNLLGHLNSLVKKEGVPSTDMRQLQELFNNLSKEDTQTSTYTNTWSNSKDGTTKTISVSLSALSKYVVNWGLYRGQLVLNRHLEGLKNNKTVYIITDVVYANKIEMEVVVETPLGRSKRKDVINKKVAVAFSYLKSPLDEKGVVGAAIHSRANPMAVFNVINQNEDMEPWLELRKEA